MHREPSRRRHAECARTREPPVHFARPRSAELGTCARGFVGGTPSEGTPMRIGYLDELKMVQLSDGEIPYARPGLGLNILGRLAKQAAG